MSNPQFKKGDEAFGVFTVSNKPLVDVCEVRAYDKTKDLYDVLVIYDNYIHASLLTSDRIFETQAEAEKYQLLLLLGGKK